MLKWLRGLLGDWRTLRRQWACGRDEIGHGWLYCLLPPRGQDTTARKCNCCGKVELARYDGDGSAVFGEGRDRIVRGRRREAAGPPPDPTPLVAAALRYRDAARAFGGANRPGADYAALLRERDAALAVILRWADRHAAAEKGGVQ